MPVTRSKAAQKAVHDPVKEVVQETPRANLNRRGTYITLTTSATGQGTHIRWHYPSTDNVEDVEIPEDHPLFSLSPLSSLSSIISQEDLDIDQRFVTPTPSGAPVDPSVLYAPVKKLQRHQDRIGFDGVPFWHNNTSGVEERLVFMPEGRTMKEARDIDELRRFRDQLNKLLDELMIYGSDMSSPLQNGEGFAHLADVGRRVGPEGTHLLGPSGTELFQTESTNTDMDTASDGPRRLRRNQPPPPQPAPPWENQSSMTGGTTQYAGVYIPSVRKGAKLGPHGTEQLKAEPKEFEYTPPKRWYEMASNADPL